MLISRFSNMNKRRKDLLVNEFCPHAGLPAEH